MARTGQKHAKIFYGWWVVLGAGMGLFVHYGPILAITFGVFFKPLSAEFGWSRTEISLPAILDEHASYVATGSVKLFVM